MHGYGQYKWANGNIYCGFFQEGMKHGRGTWMIDTSQENNQDLEIENQTKYDGSYKHDLKDGYGEFNWTIGQKFKGNYKDGKRHGYGIMLMPNNSYFMGNWCNGT